MSQCGVGGFLAMTVNKFPKKLEHTSEHTIEYFWQVLSVTQWCWWTGMDDENEQQPRMGKKVEYGVRARNPSSPILCMGSEHH